MSLKGYLRIDNNGKEFRLDISLGNAYTTFHYPDRYFEGVVSEYDKCRRQREDDWKRQMEEGEVFNKISLDTRCDVSIQQRGILDGMVDTHNDYVDLWKRYLLMRKLAIKDDDEVKASFGDVDRKSLASFIDELDMGELQTD